MNEPIEERPAHVYVDTDAALASLCRELAGAEWLTVDTEFLRERTYRPELCLVQLKYGDTLALVDALAIESLDPLLERLLDPGTVKVFHAGTQDLEIFWLLARRVPSPIFDTQLAAPLFGYAEQIGYGNLVREHLGVDLPKSQTRADWTRRPLPERQIEYALDDVIWLERLYLDMRPKLAETGRLEWLAADFQALEDPSRYDQPANRRWQKIRNVQRYRGPVLAILQALAEWRELRARESNLPRNWLLKDEVLVSLAQQRPESVEELRHVRGLDQRIRDRHGSALVALVAEAAEQTPASLPRFDKRPKPDPARSARVQLLDAWVHQRAIDLGLNPAILAPRNMLESFAAGAGRAALSGWRDGLIGDDLERLLAGEVTLRSDTDRLVLG